MMVYPTRFVLSVVVALTASLIWLYAADVCQAEIKASNLGLEIRGVISSSVPSSCVALLQEMKKGKLFAVRTGSKVFGDVTVVKIGPKTVILQRGGQLEYLGRKPDAI